MQPTFTHDDVLIIRRSLEAYIVYLQALYQNDVDRQPEIAKAQDIYKRLGEIEIL